MQGEYEVEMLSVSAPTLKMALTSMMASINPDSEYMHRLSRGKCRLIIEGVDPVTNKWTIILMGYTKVKL